MTTPEPACTVGIDLGSSAIKGVLLDAAGALIGQTTRPTELEYPAPHAVVFSAARCFEWLAEVLRTLAATAAGRPIKAVTLSGATGDTVLLDAAGEPLWPVLHWMDARSQDDARVEPPGMTAAEVHERVGWPRLRSFPLAHLAWLKREQPGVYGRAQRVGMNLTYQYFRLCGAWAMDPSTATTFYLQDQQKQEWYPPFLDWLGLRAEQLPELLPSGRCIGRLSGAAARDTGLPEGCEVRLGAFDHPSAARGAGVLEPGALLLSLGTSWVGFHPVATRAQALKAGLLVDPFLAGSGGPWGGMFSLARAGEKLNDALAQSYPGVEPVIRYQRLAQDLALDPLPSLPVVHLIQALIRELQERMAQCAQQGIATHRIVLVGGPSANPALVQLLQRALALPLQVGAAGSYAGAVGAARLARGVEPKPG